MMRVKINNFNFNINFQNSAIPHKSEFNQIRREQSRPQYPKFFLLVCIQSSIFGPYKAFFMTSLTVSQKIREKIISLHRSQYIVGFLAFCPGHTGPLPRKQKKLGYDFLTKISPKKFSPFHFASPERFIYLFIGRESKRTCMTDGVKREYINAI